MNQSEMERFLRTRNWTRKVRSHSFLNDVIVIQVDDVPPEGFGSVKGRGWHFDSYKITGGWFHLEPKEEE